MAMRLKVGREHIDYLQQYELLAVVVSQALGGGKAKDTKVNEPKTAAEAHQMFRALLQK